MAPGPVAEKARKITESFELFDLRNQHHINETQIEEISTMFNSHSRLSRIAGLTLLVMILSFTAPPLQQPAYADGGATATAIAAATVVIEALGLITTWINGQNDNCAAAALAAAWGKDCKLKKKECTDTGFYSAECEKTASNTCGKGYGKGSSEESIGGMWAGYDTTVKATADAKPLHSTTEGDSHGAQGWAKASVDGTGEVDEEQDPSPSARSWANKSQTDPIPVYAVLNIHSIDLATPTQTTDGNSSYQGSFTVDGNEVWAATAALDPSGTVTTTGDLSAADFQIAQDPVTGVWNAGISNQRIEVQVGVITPGSGATLSSVSTSVSYDAEVEADAGNAGEELVMVAVSLDQVAMIDYIGMPVLYGNTVQLVNPVTVLSDSGNFGPVLDTDITNGMTSVGLLDPRLPAGLFTGDQIYGLIGTVNTHDGRTVLTDVIFDDVVPSQLTPQSQHLSLANALSMAEDLEGDLVTLEGLSLVDPSGWPSSQNMGTVTVTDGFDQLDLSISLNSGIGGTEPPEGIFDVTGSFSQSDSEEPYDEGYQLRLRSPEDVSRGSNGELSGKETAEGR